MRGFFLCMLFLAVVVTSGGCHNTPQPNDVLIIPQAAGNTNSTSLSESTTASSSSSHNQPLAYAFAFAFKQKTEKLNRIIGFPPDVPLLEMHTMCNLSEALPSECSMGAAGCDYTTIYALCKQSSQYTLWAVDTSGVIFRVGPASASVDVCPVRALFPVPGAPLSLTPSSLVWSSCEQAFLATFCNVGVSHTAIMRINPFTRETRLLADAESRFGMFGAVEPLEGATCRPGEPLVAGLSADVTEITEKIRGSRWLGNYSYEIVGPASIAVTARPGGMSADHSRNRVFNTMYCFYSAEDYSEFYVVHPNLTLEFLGNVPGRFKGTFVNSTYEGCRLPFSSIADDSLPGFVIPVAIVGALFLVAAVVGGFVTAAVLWQRRGKGEEPKDLAELEEVSSLTEYDEELYPMLKQAKLCSVDDFPLMVSPVKFDFGLGSRQAPVNTDLLQELVLRNEAKKKKKSCTLQVLMPKSHQYTFAPTPRTVAIEPGAERTITLKITILCTTKISTDLILMTEYEGPALPYSLEVNMNTGDKYYIALKVNLESILSALIDFKELEYIEPPIGEGSYGIVYKGRWRNQEVAIKVVKNQQSKDTLTAFDNEVQICDTISSNPYQIVQFYGAVRTTGKLAIVTEFFPLGNLRSCLKHHNLSLVVKLKCMIDCAKGMKFLHHSNLLHRDLKTDNLLISSLDEDAKVNAKISDFGTTRGVSTVSVDQTFTAGIGTPAFMAPEQLSGGNYHQSADVYSFSIMLHQVMTEKEPYEDFNSLWKITEFVLSGKVTMVNT
ncbi:tyrosine protein kinase [Pelomyxa schiedti]|nr:tyrosine protein kinase [Pelomyxa schiedti]